MAKDPYKYFRIEARELLDGMSAGALELEKGPPAPDAIARLLRLAHTLKGAARVVRQPGMADAAHRIEDVLAPHRDGSAVPRERTSELLRLCDEIAAQLQTLESPVEPSAAAAAAPAAPQAVETAELRPLEIADTVRVSIGDLDSVLEAASESAVHVEALERAAAEIAEARARVERGSLDERQSLPAALERIERGLVQRTGQLRRELHRLRDDAAALRLVPADTLFAPLARAVRDAAQAMGRRVHFDSAGGDVRLDAHVLAEVRDALLHVVRNAVAHGIEAPADRLAAGKPEAGRIQLHVERQGSRAAFICTDDGRGLDREAVAKAARRMGLVRPDAALDDADVSRLIFEPGLSTSGALTEIAGRGVGLDVVRDTAARLKGEARARSEAGRGTTIEILVPITLSSLQALGVAAGERTSWIPMDSVVTTLRVAAPEIARTSAGASVQHAETAHAFASLASVLDLREAAATAQAWTTVIVAAGSATAAVGVDRLLGVSRIVVRPLPPLAGAFPSVAGATFDAFGDPQLVLDARGLVDAVRQTTSRPSETARPIAKPTILIIDDSLTTRMLEQSILEAAGYEVELATSGEEAMEKARARRFSLFLCDVEMPGMNGFEFVARAKADPATAMVPSILVTSLNSPEDRRRGFEAGAKAYIAKGEFDEVRLRGLIRDLIVPT
jgi:two-component system chemotaxis sensor kinase CheA